MKKKIYNLGDNNYLSSKAVTARSMIYCATSESYHKFTSRTIIPFSTIKSKIGDDIELLSDSTFKIKDDVSMIKITLYGCPRWDNPEGVNGFVISKNNFEEKVFYQSLTTGAYEIITCVYICNVVKNDIIKITNYWEKGEQVMWGGKNGYAILIEVIE